MVPGLFHFHPIGRFAMTRLFPPNGRTSPMTAAAGVLVSSSRLMRSGAFAAGTLMSRPPEVWAS